MGCSKDQERIILSGEEFSKSDLDNLAKELKMKREPVAMIGPGITPEMQAEITKSMSVINDNGKIISDGDLEASKTDHPRTKVPEFHLSEPNYYTSGDDSRSNTQRDIQFSNRQAQGKKNRKKNKAARKSRRKNRK